MNLGSIQLPINSATKTFGVIGKRGGGKTYTGGVMAEEFYKAKIPFVVFDPIDTWYGLRLSVDGKGKGLPIVVFGIEHADIKLDRDMGRRIAQAIVGRNVSCIISTFGMPKKAQRWLIAEFAEELLNINNTPRHVFIEEAHEFVPQRVMGDLGRTFNAVSNLVTMGRNRGIGVTILNQRAATVNKDVLTQIDTLIAMRSVGPQDRKALREWVEHHAAEGDFENFINSLPSLPTGKAWLWSPEFLGVFEQITIRKRETYHPDREKIGSNFVVPALESTDVEGFISEFSQQEEINNRREKQRQYKDEKQKRESDTVMVPSESVLPLSGSLSRAEVIALQNDYESKLIVKDGELQGLRAEVNRLRSVLSNIIKLAGGQLPANGTTSIMTSVSSDSVALWLGKLGTGGAGRMFKFLAENTGKQITRNQLALAAGLSANSGTFGTYLSKLRSNHLIVEQGGYYSINPEL